jgi:integrase
MLGKPSGKADRPKVYGATRAEVRKRLAELRRDADRGLRAQSSKERQPVRVFLETWLGAARMSTRPQTWDGLRRIVAKHIAPALGQLKLGDLRPDVIQRLYAAKLAEGLAPSTTRKIHIVLHRALAMAVRWGYLVRNPADEVDRPTAPGRELVALRPAQLNALLDLAAQPRVGEGIGPRHERAAAQWAVLWMLAIQTGCREGELLGLAWSDVDLEQGTLTVRRTLVSTHDKIPSFGEPKSKTSRRTITLPAELKDALRTHRLRQNEDRLAAPEWAEYDLVFCGYGGTPLLRRNVLRAFKESLRRAGLPESVRFQDLRHAHATMMLRAGVPLKVASGRFGALGHYHHRGSVPACGIRYGRGRSRARG